MPDFPHGPFRAEEYFWGHWAALNEHLSELAPLIDQFCATNGFAYADRRSLGRYPRIRIERPLCTETPRGSVYIAYDLSMDLDQGGERFEEFRRDLPYGLGAGAQVVVDDGFEHGTRFSKWLTCFTGRPFDQVAATLQNEMQSRLRTLEEWDLQYLLHNGERLPLGRLAQ